MNTDFAVAVAPPGKAAAFRTGKIANLPVETACDFGPIITAALQEGVPCSAAFVAHVAAELQDVIGRVFNAVAA